jgi:hypothetical protein
MGVAFAVCGASVPFALGSLSKLSAQFPDRQIVTFFWSIGFEHATNNQVAPQRSADLQIPKAFLNVVCDIKAPRQSVISAKCANFLELKIIF